MMRVEHGTKYMYVAGCRCKMCVAANSADAWARRKAEAWGENIVDDIMVTNAVSLQAGTIVIPPQMIEDAVRWYSDQIKIKALSNYKRARNSGDTLIGSSVNVCAKPNGCEKKIENEVERETVELITTRSSVCCLVPTYRSPNHVTNFLNAAHVSGAFKSCPFVLLLYAEDPCLSTYRELVRKVRDKGLDVSTFVCDGAPYCGMINRVAPTINADSICVIDIPHLPMIDGDVDVGKAVSRWLNASIQPMQVGTFGEDKFFPVVTQKMIERLGYMFHPLCYGRKEAANWLLSVASKLGILSTIPDGKIIQVASGKIRESGVDGLQLFEVFDEGGYYFEGSYFENIGEAYEKDVCWVEDTLKQILDEEAERLEYYIRDKADEGTSD